MYDNVIDVINKSKFSIIGYKSISEKYKDELISNIQYTELEVNSSSFSLKSFIRNSKIESLFSNGKSDIKYLLIDMNKVKCSSSSLLSSREKTSIIRDIYDRIYGTEYKLILVSHMNTSPDSKVNMMSGGGSSAMYMCDFAMMFKDDGETKIIKSRYEYK